MIRRSGALRCLSFTAVLFAAPQLSPIASPFWAAFAFQCSPCPQTCTSPYCPYAMSGPVDFCTYPGSGCPASYHVSTGSGNEGSGCCCYDYSPVLIDLDGGQFDKLTSAENGAVDIVAAQSIGLRTAFGCGDPDLQITALACASRAHETVELPRPERRVTLLPEDIPALCLAAGARWFVPYGQFVVGRGRPGVGLAWLRIGEGLSLARDGSTVSFPP